LLTSIALPLETVENFLTDIWSSSLEFWVQYSLTWFYRSINSLLDFICHW
jgi:hypothetical protein